MVRQRRTSACTTSDSNSELMTVRKKVTSTKFRRCLRIFPGDVEETLSMQLHQTTAREGDDERADPVLHVAKLQSKPYHGE